MPSALLPGLTEGKVALESGTGTGAVVVIAVVAVVSVVGIVIPVGVLVVVTVAGAKGAFFANLRTLYRTKLAHRFVLVERQYAQESDE